GVRAGARADAYGSPSRQRQGRDAGRRRAGATFLARCLASPDRAARLRLRRADRPVPREARWGRAAVLPRADPRRSLCLDAELAASGAARPGRVVVRDTGTD